MNIRMNQYRSHVADELRASVPHQAAQVEEYLNGLEDGILLDFDSLSEIVADFELFVWVERVANEDMDGGDFDGLE